MKNTKAAPGGRRVSQAVRETLDAARVLAASRGERAVEPHHLVLAILDRGLPEIPEWHGDASAVREQIERELPPPAPASADAPPSSWTRKVVEVALAEARTLD